MEVSELDQHEARKVLATTACVQGVPEEADLLRHSLPGFPLSEHDAMTLDGGCPGCWRSCCP